MEALLVRAFGAVLLLLLAGSALAASGLTANQAIGFTIFGACLVGMFVFALFIAREDKRRDHVH